MQAQTPPKVLVLASNARTKRDWAEKLGSLSTLVWQSADDIPPGEHPDVVVTDLASPDEARTRVSQDFQAGVITVAPADWGDVSLPTDFAARELCLACRLLAQIMQLRRERDVASRVTDEVRQLADTDPLTGLANRRAWERELLVRRQQAEQAPQSVWLAIIDLDHFKLVNDQHGMTAGDRVLREAAQTLAGQLRRDDLIARLGGDEFGVVLSGVDESAARRVCERLLAAVEKSVVSPLAKPLTASIGLASFTDAAGEREAFSLAERALREAKRAGGNKACG